MKTIRNMMSIKEMRNKMKGMSMTEKQQVSTLMKKRVLVNDLWLKEKMEKEELEEEEGVEEEVEVVTEEDIEAEAIEAEAIEADIEDVTEDVEEEVVDVKEMDPRSLKVVLKTTGMLMKSLIEMRRQLMIKLLLHQRKMPTQGMIRSLRNLEEEHHSI